MKTWLKGGLTGAIIGLTLWILSFLLSNSPLPTNIMFLGAPLCYLGTTGESIGWCWILYGHISNIILFFIIGSLIGTITKRLNKK